MSISGVSFIIIARDEQFAIGKCLASVAAMELRDCEVICVDSGSSDNTPDIALSYHDRIANLTVIRITGSQNAAMARNAGAARARRDVLFFVDGDVELNAAFVKQALQRIRDGVADAVFGMLDDYEYDSGYTRLVRVVSNRTAISREENRYLCGGIFMVSAAAFRATGDFDEQLTRCEDFDLTLRLSRHYRLRVIPVTMGNHHTVPYSNMERIAHEIRHRLPYYYGYLLRKNLTVNFRGCLAHINRAGYLKGLGVAGLLGASPAWPVLALPGITLVLLDIWLGLKKSQNIRYRLLSHYLVPLMVVYGLVTGIRHTRAPPPVITELYPATRQD